MTMVSPGSGPSSVTAASWSTEMSCSSGGAVWAKSTMIPWSRNAGTWAPTAVTRVS